MLSLPLPKYLFCNNHPLDPRPRVGIRVLYLSWISSGITTLPESRSRRNPRLCFSRVSLESASLRQNPGMLRLLLLCLFLFRIRVLASESVLTDLSSILLCRLFRIRGFRVFLGRVWRFSLYV